MMCVTPHPNDFIGFSGEYSESDRHPEGGKYSEAVMRGKIVWKLCYIYVIAF
ncbi:MAG TPA: hypothetical protein VK203_04735 [Nostocaceae cyanobacterium]|nr:hypothetical protein [Nostocaceae cyanobacterium]